MVAQSTYVTEYLSETNFALTKEDHGNKFFDLLSPLRALLLDEKEIFSYSLARYCGASSELSFFCEWINQTSKILRNTDQLFESNRVFLQKKVPTKLKGLPNLNQLIDQDILHTYLPFQLEILQTRIKESRVNFVSRFPFLKKYLSSEYMSKRISAELISNSRLYQDHFSLHSYISAQADRDSFMTIAFPCLIGFLFNFNRSDSPINPEGVRWVLLEELLGNIASLHQTSQPGTLQRMVYSSKLSDSEEFSWFQMSAERQLQHAMGSASAREQTQEIRDLIYKKSTKLLEDIIFPQNYMNMLTELLHWSYKPA
jgi:hypothetical protein